jgi:hypothetical protein
MSRNVTLKRVETGEYFKFSLKYKYNFTAENKRKGVAAEILAVSLASFFSLRWKINLKFEMYLLITEGLLFIILLNSFAT